MRRLPSLQDTVVALQALSLFAGLTQSNTDMTVTVTASGETTTYTVNRNNRLILQSSEVRLPLYCIDSRGIGIIVWELSYLWR